VIRLFFIKRGPRPFFFRGGLNNILKGPESYFKASAIEGRNAPFFSFFRTTSPVFADLLFKGEELEHRKLGWKVLILKYDLGSSLSKDMWCKMADTKNSLTTYFKRWKMHVIWGILILFVSVDKKMISPYNERYIGNVQVCAHFSSNLAHGTLIVYAQSRSYLDFKG